MSTPNAHGVYIPRDALEKLRDRAWFIKFIRGYYVNIAEQVGLLTSMTDGALVEAHSHWLADIKRIREFELKNRSEPDHFKQAGHLCYWLRRCKPVYEVSHNGRVTEDVTSNPLAQLLYKLLMKAPNEYLCFDLGYNIVLNHECYSQNPPLDEREYTLTDDYILTIAQFLANKNVSPHALFLIYKSLFLRAGPLCGN